MVRVYALLEDLDAGLPKLKPHVVTRSRHRSGRGFGVLLSALPGLITLAVERISSHLKGHQEKHIAHAVTAMRQDHMSVKNRLQQYSNDFPMHDRYNVETLDKVVDTVNSLHHHETELDSVFKSTELGDINDVMEAMSFGFDLQMYMTLTQGKHCNQYHLLELASKDLLHRNYYPRTG